MKKTLIVLFSALIIIFVVSFLGACSVPADYTEETTTDISSENLSYAEAVITEITEETEETSGECHEQLNAGTGSLFTVDSWLRICSVENVDGKFGIVAENISVDDVEYAVLTLNAKDEKLTFIISALMKGEKVYLFSDAEYSDEIVDSISFGTTDNIILYENALSLNDDIFEILPENGAVAVKNFSDVDIMSEIVIYYKEVVNNIPNGSKTGRIRLQGLKAGSLAYVKVDGINKDNCRIIFTEYDKEL